MPKIRNNNNKRDRLLAIVCGLFLSVVCILGVLHDKASLSVFTEALNRSLNSDVAYLRATEITLNEVNVPNYGKYAPVNCQQLLKEAKTTGTNVSAADPNNGVFHGKQVEIDPKFWISLHHEKFDPTRWAIMKFGFYYERSLSSAFQEALSDAPPGSRVIDVGGNIGFFTLLSAANGPVVVDTFEPNQKNQLRLCESLSLNHWHSEFDKSCAKDYEKDSMVNLYPLGVGRKEAILKFVEHGNPGQGQFVEQPPTAKTDSGLQVVTLDNFARERGWFTTRPDIAVLKIDIEGMEYTAIEGALELLQSKIVRNIFMEVSARTKQEREINKPALDMLFQNGYKLHKVGGWKGPDQDVSFPQDENIAESIMLQTEQEGAKQLNLWWKLEN